MVDTTESHDQIQTIATSISIIPEPGHVVLHSGGMIAARVAIKGSDLNISVNTGDLISFNASNADFIALRDSPYLVIDQEKFIEVLEPNNYAE